MKKLAFNDVEIERIRMTNPRSGQWSAEISFINLDEEVLAEKLSIGTKAKIEFDDEYYVGTIVSYSSLINETKIRVVAGDGKMTDLTKAKNITDTNAKQSVDAIKDGLASDNTETILNIALAGASAVDKDEILASSAGANGWTYQNILNVPHFANSAPSLFNDVMTIGPKQNKDAYVQQQNKDNAEIVAKLGQQAITQYQSLDAEVAGPQLSKNLKDKTKDNDTTWRFDRDGNMVYVKDKNINVVAAMPSVCFLYQSNTNWLRYQAFDLDGIPDPGSYIDDPTINKRWRIEEVIIEANYREVIITLKKQSSSSIIKQATINKAEDSFAKNYSAIISSQNSDGTINLNPDDDLIKGGGLKNIPVRAPFGFKCHVQAGVRAIVQYENNDPSRPYIVGFYEMTDVQHGMNSAVYATVGNTSNAQFLAQAPKTNDEIARIWDFLENTIVLVSPVGPTQPGSTAATAARALVQDVDNTRLKSE